MSKWTEFRVKSGCILSDGTRTYEYEKTVPIYAVGDEMMQAKSAARKVAKNDTGNHPLRVFVEMEEIASESFA